MHLPVLEESNVSNGNIQIPGNAKHTDAAFEMKIIGCFTKETNLWFKLWLISFYQRSYIRSHYNVLERYLNL